MSDHEELKKWVQERMGWCPEVLTEDEAEKVRELMKEAEKVRELMKEAEKVRELMKEADDE